MMCHVGSTPLAAGLIYYQYIPQNSLFRMNDSKRTQYICPTHDRYGPNDETNSRRNDMNIVSAWQR